MKLLKLVSKRGLALLVTLMMCLSLLPGTAEAANSYRYGNATVIDTSGNFYVAHKDNNKVYSGWRVTVTNQRGPDLKLWFIDPTTIGYIHQADVHYYSDENGAGTLDETNWITYYESGWDYGYCLYLLPTAQEMEAAGITPNTGYVFDHFEINYIEVDGQTGNVTEKSGNFYPGDVMPLDRNLAHNTYETDPDWNVLSIKVVNIPDPDYVPPQLDTNYTVTRRYYIDNEEVGNGTVTRSGKVGDEVKGVDLVAAYHEWDTYRGTSYTYTSCDPSPLVLNEDATKNVITLRYDYTTVATPRTFQLKYQPGSTAGDVTNMPFADSNNIDSYTDETGTAENHVFTVPEAAPERNGYNFQGWRKYLTTYQPGSTVTMYWDDENEGGTSTEYMTATWKCNGNHVDSNDDGFCDKDGCTEKVPCTHTPGENGCTTPDCKHPADCDCKNPTWTCDHEQWSDGSCKDPTCDHKATGKDCDCGDPHGDNHKDEDDDLKCDICGEDMECTHTPGEDGCTTPDCKHPDDCPCKQPVTKPGHTHVDEDKDGICDDCGKCLHTHVDGYCTEPTCNGDGNHKDCCAKAPEETTYTVTFCANGGSFSGNIHDVTTEVKKGTQVNAPDNPSRDGYDFVGWGTTFPVTVTEDVTYYAQWKAQEPEETPSINAVHALFGTDTSGLRAGKSVAVNITLTNSGNTDLTGLRLQETMDQYLTLDGEPLVYVNGQAVDVTVTPAAEANGRVAYFRVSSDTFTLAPSASLMITYYAKLTEAGQAALSENGSLSLNNPLQFVLGDLRNDRAGVTMNGVAQGTAGRSALKSAMSASRMTPSVFFSADDDFWGESGEPEGDNLVIEIPAENQGGNEGGDTGNEGGDTGNEGGDTGNEGGTTEPTTPVIPDIPTTPTTPTTPTPAPADEGEDIDDENPPLAGAIGLNKTEHFAYVIGDPDGKVRPLDKITRAEVSTIFFRLMTEEYRVMNWATTNSFTDVEAGTWYNNAISTCANAALVEGDPDGSFRPESNITHAEFVTLAARFLGDEVTGANVGDFKDTEGHWAAEAIRRAAEAGWITWADDGYFRPDEFITRAEVMSMINRMLDRTPDAEHMLPEMKTWVDNPEGTSYYADVQEATNGHDYDFDDLGVTEIWTAIQAVRDWKALETQWAANGGASSAE